MTRSETLPSAFIETYTGRLFDWRNPDLDIRDIAHALSNICRFNGHTAFHFSVASHCILVSYLCQLFDADPMEGLLHDATEAYICDIPTPIKIDFPDYKKAEKEMHLKVAQHYEVPETISPSVKQADLLSLFIEADALLPSGGKHYSHGQPPKKIMEAGKRVANTFYPIVQRHPPEVEALFIKRFHILDNRRQEYENLPKAS